MHIGPPDVNPTLKMWEHPPLIIWGGPEVKQCRQKENPFPTKIQDQVHSQNANCNRTVAATSGKSTPPTEANILTWPVLIFASVGDYSVGVRIALRWYSLLLLTGTWGCEEVQLITMTELGLNLQTDKLKHVGLPAAAPARSLSDHRKWEAEKHPLSPLIFPHPCPSLFILEARLMEKPRISHALEKKHFTLLITHCWSWCILTWLQTWWEGGLVCYTAGL